MTGRVWAPTEPQYRFGPGPVLMRSVRVIAQVVFDDDRWWHLDAEVANGTADNPGGWGGLPVTSARRARSGMVSAGLRF